MSSHKQHGRPSYLPKQKVHHRRINRMFGSSCIRCGAKTDGSSAVCPQCAIGTRRTCRYCPETALPGSDACALHQGEAGRLVNEPYRAAYNDPRYEAARARRYQIARCRCEDCGIKVGPGEWECDHVKALRDGGDPFDVKNMRIRCVVPRPHAPRGCHGVKTARDRRARRDLPRN